MSKLPIYLDHNATTPLDPRVFAAMEPHFTRLVGNPSSVDHLHGHQAGQAIEEARERVASSVRARAREIVFTSGCTEANNLAILGLLEIRPAPGHLITTAVEHPAILEPCRLLEKSGWLITYLGVDKEGRVDPQAVAAAVRPETALVTIMGANNEVGTRQPLGEIGKICGEHGIPFHSDLAQLTGDTPIDVDALGLSMASFSAHKAYGPKGAGALYVSARRIHGRLSPRIWGGGQERGLRPGTLNTPAIVGMGEAFRIASTELAIHRSHVGSMRDRLWDRLSAELDDIVRNSPHDGLANNLSVSVEGVEPLAIMRKVREVVSVSASSACATGKVETSHVLMAIFGDVPRARHALRISPGRDTTTDDVDTSAAAIIAAVRELRRFAA